MPCVAWMCWLCQPPLSQPHPSRNGLASGVSRRSPTHSPGGAASPHPSTWPMSPPCRCIVGLPPSACPLACKLPASPLPRILSYAFLMLTSRPPTGIRNGRRFSAPPRLWLAQWYRSNAGLCLACHDAITLYHALQCRVAIDASQHRLEDPINVHLLVA